MNAAAALEDGDRARCDPAAVAARVESLQAVSPTVTILRLRVIAPQVLSWRAGQYLQVRCSQGRRRAFSIANAPDGGAIELHVRFSAGSSFAADVFGSMRVGDTVSVDGPYGSMLPCAQPGRPVLLVAGGVGVAPMRALLDHYLAQPQDRALSLYWGVERREDLYLDAGLRALCALHPRLRYVPVVSAGSGASRAGVHEAVLRDHADLCGFHVHVGGPPALVAACRETFVRRGLPQEHLSAD